MRLVAPPVAAPFDHCFMRQQTVPEGMERVFLGFRLRRHEACDKSAQDPNLDQDTSNCFEIVFSRNAVI